MRLVLERALLVAVAVVACAWLGVGLYTSRLQSRAEHWQPGDSVADRRDMLDRARFLNPSTDPPLREAQILLLAGEDGTAARLLRDVADREPDNRFAWAGLAQALAESDPAAARRALSEVRRLVPPVPGAEE
jgi:hypothetical protein